MLSIAQIRQVIVDVLTSVVQAIGGLMPPLTDETKPIGALPSFDSILAEDTTVDLFHAFGLEEDRDINPFIKDERAATLAEVVATMKELLHSRSQAQ